MEKVSNPDLYIEKMQNWPSFLAINCLLALGIFLCALLGKSLGIQGPALAISVVWPATGLSLAGLLLFGERAGLGVFMGNFFYNYFILSPQQSSSLTLGLMVVTISMGSFIQALVSNYIIRTYSKPPYFRTVQDIFIFLVPASMLACLIGSTIGVTTLALGGGVGEKLIQPVWLTFWMGDVVGIYVITPLIVIWALHSQDVLFSEHIPSVIGLGLLLVAFSLMMYLTQYPLPHLFVPISIWAAYLFRMHGASLAIFLITTVSVGFAALQGYEGTSLISLISFIGVTVAASLIIAAVANERAEAWATLDSRNVYLEKEVDVKREMLEQLRSEELESPLTIQTALIAIAISSKSSQVALEEIYNLLSEQLKLNPSEEEMVIEKLQRIKQGLSDISEAQRLLSETH